MTKFSDVPAPSLLVVEGSAPSSPSAGNQRVYIDSADHRLKRKNSSGTVRVIDSGAELDYVQITSPVNITATTEATANTVVTGSAVSYDGSTVVVIEFYSPDVQLGTTYTRLWLYDGSSSIGKIHLQLGGRTGCHPSIRLTPSNASHTYSIRGDVDAGTGTVQAGAGGAGNYVPAFIRITLA